MEAPNPSEPSSAILQQLPLAQSFWRCSKTSQAVIVWYWLGEEQQFFFSLAWLVLSFVSEEAFLGRTVFSVG